MSTPPLGYSWQSITVPSCTLVNGPDSSMSSDGFVSLSPDSSTGCFQCYNGGSSKAVLFKFDGTYDATTSTTALLPGTSKGGCATDGGSSSNVWMFGGGSTASSPVVVYLTKGASSGTTQALKTNVGGANIRFGSVYDSTLYLLAYGIGMYAVNDGVGLPTSASPAKTLSTVAISGNNFYFFNATRIIRGVHSGNGCLISYMDFIGCNWTVTFSITIPGNAYGTFWACYTIRVGHLLHICHVSQYNSENKCCHLEHHVV